MRLALVVFLVASVARGQELEDVPHAVRPAASCKLMAGGEVGQGCWMPARTCIARAEEREALTARVAELEAAKAQQPPTQPGGGMGWKGVVITFLIGTAAGAAVVAAAR